MCLTVRRSQSTVGVCFVDERTNKRTHGRTVNFILYLLLSDIWLPFPVLVYSVLLKLHYLWPIVMYDRFFSSLSLFSFYIWYVLLSLARFYICIYSCFIKIRKFFEWETIRTSEYTIAWKESFLMVFMILPFFVQLR